ncbi:hypothetical protein JCGZ_15803 [Jatropha curcas]|uniref:Glycosyltransferase N-terminal domain-containing protein n=1 Tax=Jatropha curcas TaxID=180498 RepID=A0A067KYW9_JATCU|nr:hypothetical protein JCGZ_15803 [Jatropha curcas]
MGSSIVENFGGHAVCIPFPAQGHINPMLKLAKLLHRKGFHITFVNTEYNHQRLLKSRGSNSIDCLSTFRFETIPDGLPPSDHADSTQDVPSLCDSTKKNCLPPFRDLLFKLNDNTSSYSSKVPPVTCIVSDPVMSFTIEAAKELEIPIVLSWTASACGFMAYSHYRQLVEKGFVPLKDASCLTNGFLDTVIDWIPGMEGISLKYLPSFVRTLEPEDLVVNFVIGEFENARYASAIIINTFDELEHEVLMHLPFIFPNPIYTIGPLQQFQDDQDQVKENYLNRIKSNLWKEQPGCLEWLDSKKPESVIYVNFGSVTVMSPEQLIEFAWGLANSKKPFLWVIRPDLVNGDSAIIPVEFLQETKERGLLASWSSQEEVLRHPSIGGFLTHNGWNSTLESLCGENDVKRNEIERLVQELIDGKQGKELKKKVMEWKLKAEEATACANGSSYVNLDGVINEVLLCKTYRSGSSWLGL